MTNTKELPTNIETWVTALESGEYSQCTHSLYDGEGYCCLGVYAKVVLGCADEDILGTRFTIDSAGATEIYREIRVNLFGEVEIYNKGITMNDSGETFIDIAKMIREVYT
jgi:hypothetical protein